ncbi:MAG: hypothetical protein ACYDHT_06020 [Solirubrobacteraceae bacterium]
MNLRRPLHTALAIALVLTALVGGSATARPMPQVSVGSVPAIAVHVPGSVSTRPGTGSSFHWADAGAGAAIALVLTGFVVALARQGRRRGQPSAV